MSEFAFGRFKWPSNKNFPNFFWILPSIEIPKIHWKFSSQKKKTKSDLSASKAFFLAIFTVLLIKVFEKKETLFICLRCEFTGWNFFSKGRISFILRHFNQARLWASGLPEAIGIMLLNTKKYNILAVIHIFIRLRGFHLYDVICIRRMQHHRYLKIIIFFPSVLKCNEIFGFVFIMRIIKRRLLTYGHESDTV